MDATNRAFVVHLTPYRIRIKIPRRQRQNGYFTALQQTLAGHPGITSVHVNALVASIVIYCDPGFEITSVSHCFVGLELVLPAMRADLGPRQMAPVCIGSNGAMPLVSLALKMAMAIATKRLEVLIREWILEIVLRALLPRLYRTPTHPALLEAPRALLVGAAG
jgi:hypothetical protein